MASFSSRVMVWACGIGNSYLEYNISKEQREDETKKVNLSTAPAEPCLAGSALLIAHFSFERSCSLRKL
jgi:hypothetical protein